MRSHLEEKATCLQSKGRLNLKPHAVVICDDLAKLHRPNDCVAYAVIQTDVFFEVHLQLEAVEMCLRAIFVFNLQFSTAAHIGSFTDSNI